MSLGPDMQTVPLISYQEFITILLTALAVILTALGVMIAVLAIGLAVLTYIGVRGLRDFVGGLASRQVTDFLERKFREQIQSQMVAKSADVETVIIEDIETEPAGPISEPYPGPEDEVP
jgi:small-conductance mechanosensitive channel